MEFVIRSLAATNLLREKEMRVMAYTNPTPVLADPTPAGRRDTKNAQQAEGYPRHRNIYFAFIDVLGFKQTFDENRENPRSHFAKDYEAVFKYFGQLLNNSNIVQAEFSCAGQTSDSLYFYTDRIDFLGEFLKIYLHFSLYAMSQKIFFRGGIAKGDLYANLPHQFYGDCVIKAYLLEEKIAKFPRIALDRETYTSLLTLSGMREMLQEDEKAGRFYVKPFVPIAKSELTAITNLEEDQIRSVVSKDILKHIRDEKKRFEFDEHNYPKYHFLEQEFYSSDNKLE